MNKKKIANGNECLAAGERHLPPIGIFDDKSIDFLLDYF
jgi:hypothetical protein